MLTRNKLKEGEGQLVPYDLEIGHVQWNNNIAEEEVHTELEKAFHKSFYQMADWVEQLFAKYQQRITNKERNKKKEKEEDASFVNQEDG